MLPVLIYNLPRVGSLWRGGLDRGSLRVYLKNISIDVELPFDQGNRISLSQYQE